MGHTSVASLARYARPSAEALARWRPGLGRGYPDQQLRHTRQRGSWASDQLTRTAVLSGGFPAPASRCGKTAGPCYGFAATVTDQGTFRASAGALTPNQSVPGKHIAGLVTGTVSGTGFFRTFYATARPDAGLVPRWAANAFYVTSWPAQFFPPGTTITGLQLTGWSVSYGAWTGCGAQQWTDSSSNGYGDLPRDGNIAGCPHARSS